MEWNDNVKSNALIRYSQISDKNESKCLHNTLRIYSSAINNVKQILKL